MSWKCSSNICRKNARSHIFIQCDSFFKGYIGCYNDETFNDRLSVAECVKEWSNDVGCSIGSIYSDLMTVDLCSSICHTDNGFKYAGLFRFNDVYDYYYFKHIFIFNVGIFKEKNVFVEIRLIVI